MKIPALPIITLLLCSTCLWALPPEVVIESADTRVTVDIADGTALLKSIANKETGEAITFAPSSSDFVLTTDRGDFKRTDFKVIDVVPAGRVTYVVTEGQSLAVTHKYEVFDSGCVKRSLQIFPKIAVFLEKVSQIDLSVNEKPAQRLQHKVLFFRYERGGFFFNVEIPMPSRLITGGESALRATYEPVRQMGPQDSMETVPVVFRAWSGTMVDGYDSFRDYTYELSRTRLRASVRTSSESPVALTEAYDGYKALDDDITTRWRTRNVLDGKHWLEVEFPEPVTFNTMTMTVDNEDYRPVLEKPTPFHRYNLQVYVDNGWKDVASDDKAPDAPVTFPEVRAGKVRLLVEGCYGRFSLWDFKLFRAFSTDHIIADNLCSKLWVNSDVPAPFTYFNSWYVSYPGIGRNQRARGLLTYDTTAPMIPLAAQCGVENFVLDAGWKYDWYGTGLSSRWPVEFPNAEKPFVEAADAAGINLAAWFNFFLLRGDKHDHQWRVVNKNGQHHASACLLSDYYNFVKTELLSQIRNSHMRVLKLDGFIPQDECYATTHRHQPGRIRDAQLLAFMNLVTEIRKQYPDFRTVIYSGGNDSTWLKYNELIHTYEDHGGLTPGELAPTRAKMNYMHDREMFNHAYWEHLLRNQVEGSAIIGSKTPEWKEELIGNLAQSTRRQLSVCLSEFTADERNWIRDCMNWSRKNAGYLEQFKPFFPNQSVNEPWRSPLVTTLERNLGVEIVQPNALEGYAHILDDEGYIFIFNPTFHGAEYSIPISNDLGFTSTAHGLSFQIIYPYFRDFSGKLRFGETFRDYLPAEKHIVIRVTKQPIPSLIPWVSYTANETIWDSVELAARIEPAAKARTVQTLLIPPAGVSFQELTVNGKPITAKANGAYEITLEVPVCGSVQTKLQPAKAKDGKKTLTASVTISGDLVQPALMLFLYRGDPMSNERRPKAAPGTFAHRLLVNGKELQGTYGDTLEKDWETEKDAGWWVYKLPSGARKFTVTVESTDKVRPVLLLSAKQDWKEAAIVGKYARDGSNKGLLSREDPEVFFHKTFPEENEYYPIMDMKED